MSDPKAALRYVWPICHDGAYCEIELLDLVTQQTLTNPMEHQQGKMGRVFHKAYSVSFPSC